MRGDGWVGGGHRSGDDARRADRRRPDAQGSEDRLGAKPLTAEEFCREIEAYLCRKNDGHLIRIVGPSFDLVSGWAARGIPLKIASRGIDRYFERQRNSGRRRRPVRIDFCEADVLDAFDQWRRALGLPSAVVGEEGAENGAGEPSSRGSLRAHLERVLIKLTGVRTRGAAGAVIDGLLDRMESELDRAHDAARGLRGEARRSLVDRLGALDAELVQAARGALDSSERSRIEQEAEREIATFRDRMKPEQYMRAREAAIDRLVRERLDLPVLSFTA